MVVTKVLTAKQKTQEKANNSLSNRFKANKKKKGTEIERTVFLGPECSYSVCIFK